VSLIDASRSDFNRVADTQHAARWFSVTDLHNPSIEGQMSHLARKGGSSRPLQGSGRVHHLAN
jgi:hypothetical protein